MRTRYLFLFLSLVILVSCRSVPYTDRHQFLMTSEDYEMELGNQAWKETLSNSKVSENKTYNERLTRVAKAIEKAADKKNYHWEFAVIESPQANAFCLPGGKIVVYSGMFKFIDNDAELAAIVGHEVAHAIARHTGEKLTQSVSTQVGSIALAETLSIFVPVPVPWGQILGPAAELGISLPYSRTQEYEADYIGLILMAKAGYNPEAAIAFWKKFQTQSSYGALTEFFTTHPMGKKRIEEIKEELPKAMKYYEKAKNKKGFGVEYKLGGVLLLFSSIINFPPNSTKQKLIFNIFPYWGEILYNSYKNGELYQLIKCLFKKVHSF